MPATIRPVIVTGCAPSTPVSSMRRRTSATPTTGRSSTSVSLGDSELGLSGDAGVQPGSPGRMLLSIEVPDVTALLERVAALGGTVQGPANDMPWGQRVAHIADPDGNVVNLTQSL